MARIVSLTWTVALAAAATLVPNISGQDPNGPPAVNPSMTMVRDGNELLISGEHPGAPLWMVVGREPAHLHIAGILLEVEPDLVVPIGSMDRAGEARMTLNSELPRYAEEKMRFQALALLPDLRLVASNAVHTVLPIDPPGLFVYNKIPGFDVEASLVRVACAPLSWVVDVSAVMPTTGYALKLSETEADGNLFQATVALVGPGDDSQVAQVFTPVSLVFDVTSPNVVERVEVTFVYVDPNGR